MERNLGIFRNIRRKGSALLLATGILVLPTCSSEEDGLPKNSTTIAQAPVTTNTTDSIPTERQRPTRKEVIDVVNSGRGFWVHPGLIKYKLRSMVRPLAIDANGDFMCGQPGRRDQNAALYISLSDNKLYFEKPNFEVSTNFSIDDTVGPLTRDCISIDSENSRSDGIRGATNEAFWTYQGQTKRILTNAPLTTDPFKALEPIN